MKIRTQLEKDLRARTHAMRTLFFTQCSLREEKYWDCRSIYIVHETYTEEFDMSELLFCLHHRHQQHAAVCRTTMISDHAVLDNTGNNSGVDPAPSDEGDAIPAQGGMCLSQEVYVDSGNSKKVLYLLSIGLTADDNNNNNAPLFSFDREPWSALGKTSVVRPRNTDYVNEIVRRANLFNIVPLPCPSNWTRVRTLEWLDKNPVRDDVDIAFLRSEVVRFCNVLERARNDHSGVSVGVGGNSNGSVGGSGARRGNWRGVVPYLRVIMCLTLDNVKSLFLTRADGMSRQQLDARNSENR